MRDQDCASTKCHHVTCYKPKRYPRRDTHAHALVSERQQILRRLQIPELREPANPHSNTPPNMLWEWSPRSFIQASREENQTSSLFLCSGGTIWVIQVCSKAKLHTLSTALTCRRSLRMVRKGFPSSARNFNCRRFPNV